MSEKKIALLIDAENISVDFLETILKEISEYGVATYKRIYGDFSNQRMQAWNKNAIKYSMVQVQQPRYSASEKNSSDIMLVIDAMDILHNDKVEGFCIVSNDSDFTRLINRLREGGMEVIGMGGKNGSRSLIAACTAYKNLAALVGDELSEEKIENENILADVNLIKEERVEYNVQNETLSENSISDSEVSDVDSFMPLDKIKDEIKDIISRKEGKGKPVWLAEIGSQLVNLSKDFDVRNYGYHSLTRFLEDMKEFKTIKSGNHNIKVELAETENMVSKDEIEKYIVSILQKTPVELGTLGKKIREKYPLFKVQDYGYSKFERFISNIPNVKVDMKGNTTQKQASIVKANNK